MNHQSYYAIIPAPVRYCKDIADGAKLLYGEITALSNQNGYCWATNAYFAGLYGVSEKTISRWISSLAREGFIITLVDSAAANSRKMWLAGSPGVSTKMSIPMDKNVHTLSPKMSIPMDKNVHHNNTVNNTTNNTGKNSAAKPLSHPFQKVGEIEIPENISLETPKKENTSPGAGGDVTPGRSTGAVRLSIVDPELPGVRIEEEVQPQTPPAKTGRSKQARHTPQIHPENESCFQYFSEPDKARAAWQEWVEYKYSQHREKYKEAKTELAKLRQLFKQFTGDAAKFEEAVNYSIGNLYRGVFAPKSEKENGKFQQLDKAQQQHLSLARYVADLRSGAAFRDAGKVDYITGD